MALLIGQLHRAPFDSHLPYQVENLVRLVLPMPFHAEFTLDLDLTLGRVQACYKRLADDGCGASFEYSTHITENVFRSWVLKILLQVALHCISPIYISSFGPHGHTTAHLCRRKVGSIESPFQPLRVLSKSLAKIVYTGREIDCALLLSSMLRSYTADCVKMRSNAACENTLPY